MFKNRMDYNFNNYLSNNKFQEKKYLVLQI